MDLAASIQAVTEEIVLRLTRSLRSETGEQNLCLAGGVALNCVANGKVLRDGNSSRSWIQPAAGDAGGAVGAALVALLPAARTRAAARRMATAMRGAYLGPAYAQAEIEARLERCGRALRGRSSEEALVDAPRGALAEGKALGWFQGRMEFGPRALGARSILGDARSPTMQKMLNLKVKYRESFRPFAPAVLREHVADWFELDRDSPYMLLVADVVAAAPARDDRPTSSSAVRHRQAQCAALGHPGGDACRLLGAHPDRACRHQSALSRAASALRAHSPAVRCWSTPASTCAASRSSARRRTRSAASWAPTSRCWRSATAFCARKTGPGAEAELRDGIRARLSRPSPRRRCRPG